MSELLEQKIKLKPQEPSKFVVLLLNDDYSTMDFVIEVLMLFFLKDKKQANQLMMQIHIEGEGICGIYDYDLAQTKVKQVLDFARVNHQPLVCALRKVEQK